MRFIMEKVNKLAISDFLQLANIRIGGIVDEL
jgi:hypothetical protein